MVLKALIAKKHFLHIIYVTFIDDDNLCEKFSENQIILKKFV